MPRVDGHHHLVLNITDAAATHGQSVACSGAALTADVGNDRAMTFASSPGSTPYTVTVGAATTEAAVFYESEAIGRTLWNEGRWRLITTVNSVHADITLDSVFICRVNAAGVNQGTVASRTGLGVAIPTGRVKLGINQVGDVTALSTDRAYMVLVLTNANVGAQDLVLVPDGGLVTPMLIETRVGNTIEGDMTAYATAYASDVDLTAVTTWNLVGPTAEVNVTVDNQVDVQGGRLFSV